MKTREDSTRNKAVDFLKKHWKAELIGLGVVALGITAVVLTKRPIVGKKVCEALSGGLDEYGRRADEHIFTVLAPVIEKAVLDKDCNKKVFTALYPVGDGLVKVVDIIIENAELDSKEGS